MHDATQNIATMNTPFVGDMKWNWGLLGEPLVWPSSVVEADVLGQYSPQVTPVQNEELVQARCAYRANPALRDRIRFRCAKRRAHAFDAFGGKDIIKGRREFGVIVVAEEAHLLGGIGEEPQQLTSLLGDPGTIGRSSATRQMDRP